MGFGSIGKAFSKVTGMAGIGEEAQAGYNAAGMRAQYKPWEVTGSYFGDAEFDHEENTADIKVSDEIAQLRDIFMNQALEGVDQTTIADAQGFKDKGLGMFNEAFGRDTTKLGSEYYSDIQDILAPERAKSQQGLANNLFASGRMGQGSVAHEGGGYLNPERMEYLTAMNREDNQLAVESMARARSERLQDMSTGLGYYGMGNDMRMQGYNDVYSLFNMGSGVEKQGYTPFQMGSTLGTNAMQGDAAMAQMMGMGANAQYQTGAAGTGMFTNLIGAGMEKYGGSILGKIGGLFG